LFFRVVVDCSSMVGYSSRVLMEEELVEIKRGEGLMEERENSLEHNGRERERESARWNPIWKVKNTF
jgi:hypothetical protein